MFQHYVTMIIIMLVSGVLSSMWVWADKVSDIRLSLNDIYMILLMNGFMIFFMSLLDKQYAWVVGSALCVFIALWLIRTQKFISKTQYFQGMIPHHSMAVHMSKRLLENDALTNEQKQFVNNIIQTQAQEIEWMRRMQQIVIYNFILQLD
jgi:hypothetical protein